MEYKLMNFKIFCLVLLATSLIACSPAPVDHTTLQVRQGIIYLPNEQKPFTGKSETHYPNGQIAVSNQWRNGVPHGKQAEWYENGSKKLESTYADGELKSHREWDEAGELIARIEVDGDTLSGRNIWTIEESYYEINVVNGVLHGEVVYGSTNMTYNWVYEDGLRVSLISDHYERRNSPARQYKSTYEYNLESGLVEVTKHTTTIKDGIDETTTSKEVESFSLNEGAVYVKGGLVFARGIAHEIITGNIVASISRPEGITRLFVEINDDDYVTINLGDPPTYDFCFFKGENTNRADNHSDCLRYSGDIEQYLQRPEVKVLIQRFNQ